MSNSRLSFRHLTSNSTSPQSGHSPCSFGNSAYVTRLSSKPSNDRRNHRQGETENHNLRLLHLLGQLGVRDSWHRSHCRCCRSRA